MKHLRKVIAVGVLGCAVFALHAAGPVPEASKEYAPVGKPGPWRPDTAVPTGRISVHRPDFSAAIPRTDQSVEPIAFADEPGLAGTFSSHSARVALPRGRSSQRSDEEGEGSGIFDSWLLQEEGVAPESTGWGWLADSVSASEAEAKAVGDRATMIQSMFSSERRFSRNLDAVMPGSIDVDFLPGGRMPDYDLRDQVLGDVDAGGAGSDRAVSPWR